MAKSNAYKKNRMGKWAGDFLSKKAYIKKANRQVRRSGKNIKGDMTNA